MSESSFESYIADVHFRVMNLERKRMKVKVVNYGETVKDTKSRLIQFRASTFRSLPKDYNITLTDGSGLDLIAQTEDYSLCVRPGMDALSLEIVFSRNLQACHLFECIRNGYIDHLKINYIVQDFEHMDKKDVYIIKKAQLIGVHLMPAEDI